MKYEVVFSPSKDARAAFFGTRREAYESAVGWVKGGVPTPDQLLSGWHGVARRAFMYDVDSECSPARVFARCMVYHPSSIEEAAKRAEALRSRDSVHSISRIEGRIHRLDFDREVALDVGDITF